MESNLNLPNEKIKSRYINFTNRTKKGGAGELTENIMEKDENCDGKNNIQIRLYTKEDKSPNLEYLFTDGYSRGIPQREVFRAPSITSMDELYKQIYSFRPITNEDKIYPMNPSSTLDNVIISKDDMINEGERIIRWIKRQFNQANNNVISGLKLYVHNGYVHIIREGIRSYDVITQNNTPGLNFLKSQYNRPIDYLTIKNILSRSPEQEKLEQENILFNEVKKIFKQEYLIALQPEPAYLMWCLKRLLLAWYADVDLQNSIIKIKVLINQYRAKNKEEYNEKNGVLPSIVIYMRYGPRYAKLVLTKLMYLYSVYINTGWLCSTPTYFIKVNDLIYYTNGLLDIKEYYNKVLKTDPNVEKPFNPSGTMIQNATDIIQREKKIQEK